MGCGPNAGCANDSQDGTATLHRLGPKGSYRLRSSCRFERAANDRKGRVYDCGYARDPKQAAQDRHRLSAVHQTRGFVVVAVNWTGGAD